MKAIKGSVFIFVLVIIAIAAFYTLDLQQWFTLDTLKHSYNDLLLFKQQNPLETVLYYAVIYIVFCTLALPGAPILTLAGGAMFGLFWGGVLISFTSTLGATLAFLVSRNVFREPLKKRFTKQYQAINQGVEKDGIAYLVSIRVLPIFPFFMINVLMGMTSLKTWTYYWVSQLSMLPATLIYVNAGTQLSQIKDLSDVISFDMFIAFFLLGLFPWLSKWMLNRYKNYRLYKQWDKPARFDNNMLVIGAGAGGLVTAYIAAALKARVTLIEKQRMGGDCLHTGCVPSKTLIRTSKLLHDVATARQRGVSHATAQADFAEIMRHVQATIDKIQPHDSVERYQALGVNVIEGEAMLETPWRVSIKTASGEQRVSSRNIVIASGASPFVPDIPGLQQCDYYTSDSVWTMPRPPHNLLVLGAGAIGCELAQAFSRLGINVSMVEREQRILQKEDADVAASVHQQFIDEGITLYTGTTAQLFKRELGKQVLVAQQATQTITLEFDAVLIALGRKPQVAGFGLEQLGVKLSARQTIEVNPFLQTNYPNIYACGDVAGPFQFTHVAAHQAWHAAVNALFGRFKRFKVDYSYIPWATFVDPEVARVGLNEQEAKRQQIPVEVSMVPLSELDRAITDGVAKGFIKVLTVPGRDKILGVTIVGEHAGDLIAEYVLAMKHGLGMNKILTTPHIYPTLAEANKYAAGQWKRQHAPQAVLKWLARYHRWNRDD